MNMKHILSAVSLAILSACGNVGNGPSIGQAVLAGMQAKLTGKTAPASQPITRATVADRPGPLLLANLPRRKAQGTLSLASQSGDLQTFMSPDGISITLQNGIIRATRGFGSDVMAVRLSALPHLNPGQITRDIQFLDGEDQIQTVSFTCTTTKVGPEVVEILDVLKTATRVEELCTGSQGRFKNAYWVADGIIWKSQQWISPALGPIIIDKLK